MRMPEGLRLRDPQVVEMRRVSISILGYGADHLCRSQAINSGLPARDRDLREGAKGHSALQLSRDLDCQYRTATCSRTNYARLSAQRFTTAKNCRVRFRSTACTPEAIESPRTRKPSALTVALLGNRPANARSWLSRARSWGGPYHLSYRAR